MTPGYKRRKPMIGKLTNEVLESLLETLPLEFSVLDAEDRVLAWNRHATRIFKRPEAALGRNVRDCHPKHSLAKVEAILSEMKTGKRDRARFWIDLGIGPEGKKEKVLIEYHALRGKDGKYLGCLEASQNVSDIQSLTGEKRLLD
jgi:PAS domain S-box-containing protein